MSSVSSVDLDITPIPRNFLGFRIRESPLEKSNTMSEATLGGRFTFPGTSLTVQRIGFGAMQLAGPGVWGPPKDPDGAVEVLREAVAAGVNHIDTADFYDPHVTNQIIRQALHAYPTGVVIVTKLGAGRPPDKSWQPAISPQDLTAGVHDNLRNLGLDALDIVTYRVMGSGRGPEEGSPCSRGWAFNHGFSYLVYGAAQSIARQPQQRPTGGRSAESIGGTDPLEKLR
jgi:hypothetical protein